MRSSAVWLALAFTGVAAGSALLACATGADTLPSPIKGASSTSSSSSSGGNLDASEVDSTLSGSSGGYGDDSTPPPVPVPDGGTPPDDGGGTVPGPTCTPGQACVDGIPSGWSGFVQLLLGSAASSCAAPYATPQPQLGGKTNPDGGPATCGTCSCALPEAGISCSVGVLYDDTQCLIPNSPTTVPQGPCTSLGGFVGGNGGVSAPKLTGGACVPQPGAVTGPLPTPSSTTAVACAPADAGAGDAGGTGTTCASGQACATLPAGADGGVPSGVCVYQSGIQDCPQGTAFTTQYVVGALEDDRGCGCSCADPQCPGDGYLEGYTNNTCSGTPAVTFDAGSGCNKNLSTHPTHGIYKLSRSGARGTCTVADAGPSGAVTIDGGTATTFCCIP